MNKKERIHQLFDLGFMKYDGEQFIGNSENISDFNIHNTEITCDTYEEFNEKIELLKKEYEKRR